MKYEIWLIIMYQHWLIGYDKCILLLDVNNREKRVGCLAVGMGKTGKRERVMMVCSKIGCGDGGIYLCKLINNNETYPYHR